MIQCKICGKSLNQITRNHLVNHKISILEYKNKFPHAPLQSEESKRYGATNAFYGKRHNIETKSKISNGRIGKKLSTVTKEKISQNLKNNSLFQGVMKEEKYRNKLSIGIKNHWDKLTIQERKQRLSKLHKAQIEKGRWISLEKKDLYEAFEFQVRKLTEQNYKIHFHDIPNSSLRGKGYDLDHKLSIKEGFELGLSVETLSHYLNLECIKSSDNKRKSYKSSISKKLLNELIDYDNEKQLLLCGGLAGHMQHLYDNENLSFGDMKAIFDAAGAGKLENVTEKIDGQNIFITWNVKEGKLKAARNKGNIKTGGMDADALAQKFVGRGTVYDAFVGGFGVINKALSSLDPSTLTKIFGENGNVWFSVEIVYPANSNIINYDKNAIVFHKSGNMYDSNGNPIEDADLEGNFNQLMNSMELMQQKVANSNWKLYSPILVPLQKLNSDTSVANAKNSLSSLMSSYGLSDSNTVGDLINARVTKDVLAPLGLPDEINKLIVDRLAERPNAPDIKTLKEKVPPQVYNKVNELIKSQPAIMQKVVEPLELIVHEFAVEVLKGVQSVLALHPNEQVARLRDEVGNAITKIQGSGNQDAIAILNRQLEKLKSADRVTSSMEGIVFQFKGDTYKLSGNFAPVNQILGLFKYGRGKIKPIAQ